MRCMSNELRFQDRFVFRIADESGKCIAHSSLVRKAYIFKEAGAGIFRRLRMGCISQFSILLIGNVCGKR